MHCFLLPLFLSCTSEIKDLVDTAEDTSTNEIIENSPTDDTAEDTAIVGEEDTTNDTEQGDTAAADPEEEDTSIDDWSCWVSEGLWMDLYCFQASQEWSEPGFQVACEEQSYLRLSSGTCPEINVSGICTLPFDAGGDYLGEAVGFYYGNSTSQQELGCTQANGVYQSVE